MKHAGSLESTQEARVALTHLSCSPNFPRASNLDERTLTHEPIVYQRTIEGWLFERSGRIKGLYVKGLGHGSSCAFSLITNS